MPPSVRAPMLSVASSQAPNATQIGVVVAAELIGLTFARYVLRAPTIVAMSTEELVDAIAPALEVVLGGTAPAKRSRH